MPEQYMSTKETGRKWSISARQVAALRTDNQKPERELKFIKR